MGHIDSRVIKQIWKTTALKRKLSVETRVLVVEDRVASTCRLSKDLGNFWYRCLPKHFWNSGAPLRRRYSMMSGFVDELPCNNFFLQYIHSIFFHLSSRRNCLYIVMSLNHYTCVHRTNRENAKHLNNTCNDEIGRKSRGTETDGSLNFLDLDSFLNASFSL